MNHNCLSQTQAPNIVNIWNPLDLASANVTLPGVETAVLQPTYPVDPAWLMPESLAFNNGGASINGSTVGVNLMDVGALAGSSIPEVTQSQMIHFISLQINGGTVSPIATSINIYNGAAGGSVGAFNHDIPNPGFITVGPFYLAPGWDARIFTNENGGSGDTFFIWAWGVQSSPGIPIRPVGPPTFSAGTLS